MKNSLREKDIERLLKGANSIIISTDNGIGVAGNLPIVLSNLAMIIYQLSSNGCPKELIDRAVKIGLDETEIQKKTKKEKDNFKEMIKDTLKNVRDDLEKLLGDDKDE